MVIWSKKILDILDNNIELINNKKLKSKLKN